MIAERTRRELGSHDERDSAAMRSMNSGRRRPVIVALLATVTLLAAACAGSGGPAQTQATGTGEIAKDTSGTVRILMENVPDTDIVKSMVPDFNKDYPNIKIAPTADGVATGWDPATATKVINDFIASGQYDKVQGIWTSGMDSMIVDAIKAANKPYVPIVGADLGAFVTQLLNPTGYPGLKGAAVTNTAAVGGAGITLALKLLKGEAVTTQAAKTVLLNPVAVDNTSDAGKATLKSWQVTGLNPSWPLGLKIDSWTTYTGEQAVACKGPGE